MNRPIVQSPFKNQLRDGHIVRGRANNNDFLIRSNDTRFLAETADTRELGGLVHDDFERLGGNLAGDSVCSLGLDRERAGLDRGQTDPSRAIVGDL